MLEKINHNSVPKEIIDTLITLYKQGKFTQIIGRDPELTRIYPSSYNLLNIFGSANLSLERYQEAIKYFIKAIKLNPHKPTIYYNLGLAYHHIGNMEEAITYYEKAIELKPDYAEAYCNLGMSFNEKRDLEKAIESYEETIKIDPNHAGAYMNLGNAFVLCGDCHTAIENYKKAISLDDGTNNFLGGLLFASNYSHDMSAEEIFEYYKQYDKQFGLPHKSKWKPFAQPKNPHKKLKIGYVSPDFKKHAIQNFLLPILTHHDHQKFEIYAFAELKKEDSLSLKYKSYADHWIRTDRMNDDMLVQKIRELEIDILVDLAGHTRGNRLSVFAQKPAPVSLSWLGYGYTTGLSAIDYFLTDEVVVPKGREHLFSEQPWRLNNYAFFCYQAKTVMGEVSPLPALENKFITFGSLTRAIRINDRVVKTWAAILKRVKNSKLIINSTSFNNTKLKDRYIKKFHDQGIETQRLDFYSQSPPWNSMRQIDIALDCFPHNSGTTLIEYIYMGTPFINYSNRPSVGRIGASILTTLGRPEWITFSEQEYIEKAVSLATNTRKLAKIRETLREEMETSPLMDQKGFVCELEKTYQNMWDKWLKKY